jgi:predicted ferric reductase
MSSAGPVDRRTRRQRNRRLLEGAFWVTVYLALSLVPLLLVLIGPRPPGRDFWTELSVALGFVGLAMIGLQFAVTARFHSLAAPFGLDILLRFHREISLGAFAVVMAHPLILFIAHPEHLELLRVTHAPWRARFALLGILMLILLIVISIWRERLRIEYETWRVLHGALAVAAIAFSMLHIAGVEHYLNLPWHRALWAFMAAGAIGLLGYVRIYKPVRMLMRPFVVEEVRRERGDSWTVRLAPSGHAGTRFQPGQFAWLTLWHSPFAVEEHPFSFSSSAEHPGHPEFTIKELGDFTAAIAGLEPGTRAYLDGPYGAFSYERYPAGRYVFIAGGVGITPIMGMLRTMADRREGAPMTLVYAVKRLEEATFREEIEGRLAEALELEVVMVPEEPPEGWEGESGFVDADLLRRHLPRPLDGGEYFVCGPPAMLDAVDVALGELEVPARAIHMERFNLV